MPKVTLPDGRVVNFPDTMSLGEIEAAAARLSKGATDTPSALSGFQHAESIKGPMSVVDRLLSFLPMIGGAAGGVIGGAGGTAFGAGFGGVPGAVGGAAFGGATGEAMRQNARRLMPGRTVPTSAAGAATDIGEAAAIQGGAEALGGAVTKGAVKGAQAIYRGYLKPSLAAGKIGKAHQIVQIALDEAIPISRAGAEITPEGAIGGKAGRVISDLRSHVDDIIAKSNETLDLRKIATSVRAFAKRTYFKPGGDLTDYKAALAVADRIDRHPSLRAFPTAFPRAKVSLAEANEAKRLLQRSASPSYGLPNAAATDAAEKQGARAFRVGLERKTGGGQSMVRALNARESKLIPAAKAIAQAVEREANQSKLYGVKTLMAGAYGGNEYRKGESLPMSIAKFAGARMLLTPGAQSGLAILANKLSRQLGIGAASATRLAAYVLSEPKEEAQ